MGIDNFNELNKEIKIAKKKQVFTRHCVIPDAKGAIKIINDNPNISVFKVIPRLFDNGCDEFFYVIENNEDLQQRARKILLENFGAGR